MELYIIIKTEKNSFLHNDSHNEYPRETQSFPTGHLLDLSKDLHIDHDHGFHVHASYPTSHGTSEAVGTEV